MAKEKKVTTKPKKERKHSISELKERKNFMFKMAFGTLGVFAIISAIFVPIALVIY
jgi:hypothetical protein